MNLIKVPHIVSGIIGYVGIFMLMVLGSVSWAFAFMVCLALACRGVTTVFVTSPLAQLNAINGLLESKGLGSASPESLRRVVNISVAISGIMTIVVAFIAYTSVSSFLVPSALLAIYVASMLTAYIRVQGGFNKQPATSEE